MAHDQTEPKSGLIFFFGLLSVATLFALQLVFDSYFLASTETEISEKILTSDPIEWKQMKSSQEKAIHQGSMPIDKAMKLVARQKRGLQNPSEESQAQTNWAPVEGWTMEGQIYGEFSGPSEMKRVKNIQKNVSPESSKEENEEKTTENKDEVGAEAP